MSWFIKSQNSFQNSNVFSEENVYQEPSEQIIETEQHNLKKWILDEFKNSIKQNPNYGYIFDIMVNGIPEKNELLIPSELNRRDVGGGTYMRMKYLANRFGFDFVYKAINHFKIIIKLIIKKIPPANKTLYRMGLDFLDYFSKFENFYISRKTKERLPFMQAREFVRNLGFKTWKQWMEYCKSGQKPANIPSSPQHVYVKEWQGYADWLGTHVGRKKTVSDILPYEAAKKHIQQAGIENWPQFWEFIRSGKKPLNIPSSPSRSYKGKGWVDAYDWFGKEKPACIINWFKKIAQISPEESENTSENDLPVITQENIGEYIDEDDKTDEFETQGIIPETQEQTTQLDEIPQETEDDYSIISRAIDTNQCLLFEYISRKGKFGKYLCEPYGTFIAQGTGNELLVTYSRNSGGIRAFIINNILPGTLKLLKGQFYSFIKDKFIFKPL